MIKFRVRRSGDGKIEELKVTTACQMTVNGIEAQGLAAVSYETGDGLLECTISSERNEGADVLLESLMITIYEIAKQYGKYLFITEV